MASFRFGHISILYVISLVSRRLGLHPHDAAARRQQQECHGSKQKRDPTGYAEALTGVYRQREDPEARVLAGQALGVIRETLISIWTKWTARGLRSGAQK